MNPDLKTAIETLIEALKTDEGYRYSWEANIAMSVYDAARRAGIDHSRLHEVCNVGAANFLNLLIYMGE